MNILVLTEYFPTSDHADMSGGVESRAFHLLKEVAKKHNITVLCSYQTKQRRVDRFSGINVIRVGMNSPYSSKGNIIPRLTYAFGACLAGLFLPKIDVVEGYSYLTYPVVSLIGTLRGKKTVATYHESWSFAEWVKLKGFITGTLGAIWTGLALLMPFKRYIAVSNATKQRLVEQGIKSRKISVVHNGVDLDLMSRIKTRQIPNSISTSARLIKGKRLDVLIKAIGELKKSIPKIQLTIHGVGEEQANLESLIKKLGLQKNVTIKGKIQKFEDVLKMRQRHKVFCLPSEVEGFGMVVVEAMALGVPAVVTDIPVLKEITKNGTGGALFKAGDHKDLAEKLKKLLTDTKLYSKKSKEALKHAKNFGWIALGKQTEAVYRK